MVLPDMLPLVLACVNNTNGLLMGLNLVQNNFTSLFVLNMLSILHNNLNSLRYEASKLGLDFLDTLYE